MVDKLGQEIKVGCMADVFVSDIVSAYVVEVQDGGIAGPDGRPQPPVLVLSVAIPMKLRPGQAAPIYVTHPPAFVRKEPSEKEN